MVDVFDEVDEQVRSEQVIATVRKYAPAGIGVLAALLAIALAWWGYTAYNQSAAEKASAAYAQALDTLKGGDAATAFTQLDAAAKSPSAIYRSLALQVQGAIRLDQDKIPEAVALFDAAAKAAPDKFVGDTARLKSAYALLDTASYADIEARLKPLTDPQRPLSALAKEALAFAKLKAGKTADARKDFVSLSLLPSASDDVHARAHAALALIDDGSAAQLNDTVKAALSASSNPLFPEGPPNMLAPGGAPADPANSQPEAAQ